MQVFGTLNEAMFDWPWSGIHFSSGLAIGVIGTWWGLLRPRRRFWWIGSGALTIWEVYEATLRYFDIHHHQFIAAYKASVMNFAFGAESWWNVAGDLMIGLVGMIVGRWVVSMFQRQRRT